MLSCRDAAKAAVFGVHTSSLRTKPECGEVTATGERHERETEVVVAPTKECWGAMVLCAAPGAFAG